MKIGIQTWGTEGDIRPFAALAAQLGRIGHEVTLAVTGLSAEPSIAPLVNSSFSLRQVGRFDPSPSRFEALAAGIFMEPNPVKRGLRVFTELFDPFSAVMLAGAETLCKQNDLIISHFLVYPAKIAARKYGRPLVSVYTTPMIPSRHVPPMDLPQIAPFCNRLAWKLFDTVLAKTIKPAMDRLYRQAGVATEKSVLNGVWPSPLLNLVSVSPSLFPPPADWAGRFHLCGHMDVTEPGKAWRMPDSLRRFLAAGPPPVYMTFGSMIASDPDPRKITALLGEAARRADCRAIVQSRWDLVGNLPVGPGVFPVIRASHREVFPHCAAVVHHGGSGTTQTATAAGCPSVVVEHATDQPLWASVLHRAGIAPRMLHRRSLTAGKLARAVRQVLTDPSMPRRAKRIARGMRREDGIACAMELIAGVTAGAGKPGFNSGCPGADRGSR